YTTVSGPLTTPPFTVAAPFTGGVYYFRCAVTCGTSTAYSDTVAVNVQRGLAAGSYTIDAGSPASSTNFPSFNAAVSAISCGVTGPVVFNVVANSGPYNENLILAGTMNTNAFITITFNGNGETLTNSNGIIIQFDGADYITFNDLNVVNTSTSDYTIHFGNASNNNSFNRCTISATQSTSSSSVNAIVFSGSPTSYSTQGDNGNNNSFDSCDISGGYIAVSMYGMSSDRDTNNSFTNSTIHDFYYYGLRSYYQHGLTVSNCIIERPNRTSFSTFYGMYLSTGNQA